MCVVVVKMMWISGGCFQGFTYVAPSLLEEMTKPWRSTREPRSVRRSGSLPM